MWTRLLALFLLTPSAAFAVPAITTVSDVTVEHGQSITVDGSGFGTHALDLQWLGANLEAGTNGAVLSLPAGWSAGADSSTSTAPRYSTARAHSGTKAVLSDPSDIGSNNILSSSFMFDHTTMYDVVYLSYWMYLLPTDDGCADKTQFKALRISPTSDYNDTSPEFLHFWWYDCRSPFSQRASLLMNFCEGTTTTTDDCYPTSISQRWYPAGAIPDALGWARVEVFASASTADVKDGSYWYKITENGAISTPMNFASIQTRKTETPQWRYVQFQNYWGNGGDHAQIWLDDIYIQFGTQSRIELCNASTRAAATQCETQVPTAWADGQIAVSINTGDYGNGSAWLYVVDSSGGVNASGYEVTIGGEANPAPVISAGSPTGDLATGTTSTTISWTTNEAATCKWGVTDGTYATLPNGPTVSGTSHSDTRFGLADGNIYTTYVRCQDGSAAESDTYSWQFRVGVPAQAVSQASGTFSIH